MRDCCSRSIKEPWSSRLQVVQRGPQGSFAYVVKDDGTAEMRTIDVAQIEDGVALINRALNLAKRLSLMGSTAFFRPGQKST